MMLEKDFMCWNCSRTTDSRVR